MKVQENPPKNNNKQKRSRVKYRTAVFAIIFLCLLGIAAGVLLRTVLFPIEQISVTGNSAYSDEDIIANSGISLGDKIFSVSSKETEKKITVDLPYITEIKLTRKSFSTIELQVIETDDILCYQIGTMFYTADANNKALSKFATKPQNTVLVTTPKEVKATPGYIIEMDEQTLDTINEIFSEISKHNITMQSIDVTNLGSINVLVDNKFSVNLGSAYNLEGEIAHLNGMLPQIVQKNGNEATGKIDLSTWSTTKREGFFELTKQFQ